MMQDERSREAARANAGAPSRRVPPSSSRMLTGYLSEVEQLLDVRQWEPALREALDLPQIAVALSDAQLSASPERIKAWCDEWIRTREPDRNAHGADYGRAIAAVLTHTAQPEHADAATVPLFALKRLRLRRHARNPPRGFSADRSSGTDAEGIDAIDTCNILVEATRRWYAQSAVHDSTVQANLSRLAVLR